MATERSLGMFWIIGIPAIAAVLISLGTASARPTDFTLKLCDPNCDKPSASITIIDNGPGDNSPLAGVISYVAYSLGDWVVSGGTGLSKPIEALPEMMDLSTLNVSLGGGALEIMLSDKGFTNPDLLLGLASLVGGTILDRGYAEFKTYVDDTNNLFGRVTQVADLGPFSGAFSDSKRTPLYIRAPYSLTIDVFIAKVLGQPVLTNLSS